MEKPRSTGLLLKVPKHGRCQIEKLFGGHVDFGGRRLRSKCIKAFSKAVWKMFKPDGWETRLISRRSTVGLGAYGDGMDGKTAVVPLLVLIAVGHRLVFNTSSLLSCVLLRCQASAAQSLRQRIPLLANT